MKLEKLCKVNSHEGTCGKKIVNVSDFCRPRKLKVFAVNDHVSQHNLTDK